MWLIESALASESRRLATPARGTPLAGAHQVTGVIPTIPSPPPGAPGPGIHDHADVVGAEQDLIKALVSEAESLKKLNPFLVLGVGYEAGDAEVRAAFGELTKRYHPDRFARYESPELRQVAAEIFILIRDAYRRLGDAAARAQALQSLGKPAPAPRAIPAPLRAPSSLSPPPSRATQRVPVVPVVPGAPAAPMLPTVTVPVPAVIRPPAARRDALRRPTGDPPTPAGPLAPAARPRLPRGARRGRRPRRVCRRSRPRPRPRPRRPPRRRSRRRARRRRRPPRTAGRAPARSRRPSRRR